MTKYNALLQLLLPSWSGYRCVLFGAWVLTTACALLLISATRWEGRVGQHMAYIVLIVL